MRFKFKVGDKVRVNAPVPIPENGKEGVVVKLGGIASGAGAVVKNETFGTGDDSYGEHGICIPDNWLVLVRGKPNDN